LTLRADRREDKLILLSSSAFDDPQLLPFSLSATGKTRDTLKVCIIVSASPMKATGPNAIKTMDYLIQNGVSTSQFVDLCEGQKAKETIRGSDLIILNGGNPFLLLSTLKDQNYLAELEEISLSEKIVVGVSAGAMMFSPGLHLVEAFNQLMGFDDKGNIHRIEDLECLNLFDQYFFPHYDLFCQRVHGLAEKLTMLESRTSSSIYRQSNGQTARVIDRRIEELSNC